MSLNHIRLVPIPDDFTIAQVGGLIPNVPRYAEIAKMNIVDSTRSEKRSEVSLTKLGPISANGREADINYCANDILLQSSDNFLDGTPLIPHRIEGRVWFFRFNHWFIIRGRALRRQIMEPRSRVRSSPISTSSRRTQVLLGKTWGSLDAVRTSVQDNPSVFRSRTLFIRLLNSPYVVAEADFLGVSQ